MKPELNLNKIYNQISREMSKQSVNSGGQEITPENISDCFNGSSLSGLVEEFVTSSLNGENCGSEQTNYDVRLTKKSKHWSKQIEVRNMVTSVNFAPSTSLGHNRHMELDKTVDKFKDVTSYIIFDVVDQTFYEIPGKLVVDLWLENKLGGEVKVNKVPQGYCLPHITRSRFLCMFPKEQFEWKVTSRHLMSDVTVDEIMDSASLVKGFRKPADVKGKFNFSKVKKTLNK